MSAMVEWIKNTSREVACFAPGVVQTSTKVNISRQVENGI